MNLNSLFFWWPHLRDERMPKTVGVVCDIKHLFPALDGEDTPDAPWAAFEGAAKSVGFPVFVRTDQSSAKHDGPQSYRINSLLDLQRVIEAALTDNCLKNLEGSVCGFVFRQWIELDGRFTAFHGHPIAPEVRIFVEARGKETPTIDESYFYWPEEAFEGHCDDPEWRKIRQAMETETMVSSVLLPLQVRAIEATKRIGFGEWSIDFARDKNGDWWLIDMALASDSWRPEN